MKILLALVLAGSIFGQTKNYNVNVVHQGAVNSTGATATRPFREVSATPSGACSVEGEIVSLQGSQNVYKCTLLSWALITGAGESITATLPIVRTGDVLSCPTCATVNVTSLVNLAAVGVIGQGVWQGTRVAVAYGGTSSDLSATGPGFLKQASLGSVVTVGYPAYSDLTGVPSTFTPSAHASSHQHGGSDAIATATPGANGIPKARSDSKLAAGWLTEVLSLANLSDVTGKQGNGTLVGTVCGTLIQGNAVTTDSAGCLVDAGVTPGGGGSSAFSGITSATNTQAAMVVGTGASLTAAGAGTIAATSAPFSGVLAGTSAAALHIGSGGSLDTTGTGTIIATALAALTGLPAIADQRILGNNSGGSAAPSVLTPSSARSVLGVASSSTASVGVDFASAVDGQCVVVTGITVTGATVSDGVQIGPPTALLGVNRIFNAWVTGSNTVTAEFCNNTGNTLDLASGTFQFIASR